MAELGSVMYIEKETHRKVKARQSIIFDSIFWIIDYVDEPPVNYVYSDSEFKRLFEEGN